MKKRFLKVVTAWALILSMAMPMMMSVQAQEDVVGDAIKKETFVVQHHSAIDTYRTGEKFTAPDAPTNYSDYLFAGWYADENCETAKDSEYKSGEAYAKFVHKDVLGVKAQVVSGTNFNTEQAKLRFVSTVDSLDYLEVGFKLNIQEEPYSTDVVYRTLYAMNNAGVVLEEYTPDLFHETSKYFFACIVTGINNAVFDYGIQVAPYWITPDGTTVQAEYVTKSVSDGYMFKSIDADVISEGEITLADYTLQGGSIGGAYYYLVATNVENTSTKIYRLKRNDENTAWNTTPNKEVEQTIAGVNDITYNGTEKVLVMVNGSAVTLIDRSSLGTTTSETITTTSIELDIESIKYNKNHNKYVAMLSDGTLKVLNADFSVTDVATVVPASLNGYTAKSVTADDSYIYQAFAKTEAEVASNKIAVYRWDGSYVTTINVVLTAHEITTIDIANNVIYAACATANGISLYNIDILKTFDIAYDYGTGAIAPEVENPTGYTIKSESFTLNQPTRPGYTFEGWKETIYVNKWYDGYLDVHGDVVTPPPAGREDSIYSEPIYIQGKVNYTLNAPGLTTKDTIRACMQWDSDRDDMNILTKSYDILTAENGYMELLFVLGAKGTDLEKVTITRNTSTRDIEILKGSTCNRHYEAVWEANSYTVEYNSNVEDGATVNGTMTSSSHVYGTTKALNANAFTRTDGYVFVGWNTEPDGSGTTYSNEASVMNLTTEANGTVTLYAQWKQPDVYTITYDLDGGTMPNSTSNPTSYVKTTESFTLYEPTRPGYTFEGWKETIYVNKWYDGYLDVHGNVVANPPADREDSIYSEPIYIQGKVNYTLNAPGLTTKDTIRACMQWDSDRTDQNILTKSYDILTSENGYMELLFVLGAKGTDLENVTITRNTSTRDIEILKGSTCNRHYEAVWEANSYTVEYNSNAEEGATVNGTMASSSHVYGTTKALNANAFTRTDGYVFVGWNTEPDGSGTTYGNGASVKNLTTEANGTVTLYAQWTNQDVYTITYNLDGGTMPNGTSNPTAYAKTTESFTLYEPTRPDATFLGWKETIYVNKWYDGYLDVHGNVVANPPADREDSIYSEPIYIQGNVKYTLNAPGLTDVTTIRACMQWDSDRADQNILTSKYDILTSENGYMELLFVLGAKGTDLEKVTITRNESTSDIVIPKGSTCNRHYEAVWEEEVSP